eukprot:3262775-Pyramimonas_sp.AAC.1
MQPLPPLPARPNKASAPPPPAPPSWCPSQLSRTRTPGRAPRSCLRQCRARRCTSAPPCPGSPPAGRAVASKW